MRERKIKFLSPLSNHDGRKQRLNFVAAAALVLTVIVLRQKKPAQFVSKDLS
jgi:hypothetical protein